MNLEGKPSYPNTSLYNIWRASRDLEIEQSQYWLPVDSSGWLGVTVHGHNFHDGLYGFLGLEFTSLRACNGRCRHRYWRLCGFTQHHAKILSYTLHCLPNSGSHKHFEDLRWHNRGIRIFSISRGFHNLLTPPQNFKSLINDWRLSLRTLSLGEPCFPLALLVTELSQRPWNFGE